MSVEEMRVGKDKLKAISMMAFDYFAPAETKNNPQFRQLVQSLLNFCDMVLDEKLLVDANNLIMDIAESVVRHPEFDIKNGGEVKQIFFDEISSPQRISQFHNLLRSWTNHLNQLAGEETQNSNLPVSAETNIFSKISAIQNSPTGNDNSQGTPATFNLLSDTPNSLISPFSPNVSSGKDI